MKIYLSYSMTHDHYGAIQRWAELTAKHLRGRGHDVFVPHEHFPVGSPASPAELVENETKEVLSADVMVTRLAAGGSDGCGAEYQIASSNEIPILAGRFGDFKVSRFTEGLINASGGLWFITSSDGLDNQELAGFFQWLDDKLPTLEDYLFNWDHDHLGLDDGCQKEIDGKTHLELVHPLFPAAIARVLQRSWLSGKYDKWNWFKGGSYQEFYGALRRHVDAWYEGRDKDPETGESHLAHAGCDLMFLLVWQELGKGTDDRLHTLGE